MSYQPQRYQTSVINQGQGHVIREFVPNYVVRSDYLPTNRVIEGDGPSQQWYHQYEEQKRRGRVFTQRPADFNPARYKSVKIFENVQINNPITQEQFQRVIHK